MTKWEYMTLTRRIVKYPGFGSSDVIYRWDDGNPKDWDELLNELGEQGWELVSAYPQASSGGEAWAGVTDRIILIFKRPK